MKFNERQESLKFNVCDRGQSLQQILIRDKAAVN